MEQTIFIVWDLVLQVLYVVFGLKLYHKFSKPIAITASKAEPLDADIIREHLETLQKDNTSLRTRLQVAEETKNVYQKRLEESQQQIEDRDKKLSDLQRNLTFFEERHKEVCDNNELLKQQIHKADSLPARIAKVEERNKALQAKLDRARFGDKAKLIQRLDRCRAALNVAASIQGITGSMSSLHTDICGLYALTAEYRELANSAESGME